MAATRTLPCRSLAKPLKAKMDTGAYTASLSAKDIELFTRDGNEWVRFRLATKNADGKVYEHELSRISKIKNRVDEDEEGTSRKSPSVQ